MSYKYSVDFDKKHHVITFENFIDEVLVNHFLDEVKRLKESSDLELENFTSSKDIVISQIAFNELLFRRLDKLESFK